VRGQQWQVGATAQRLSRSVAACALWGPWAAGSADRCGESVRCVAVGQGVTGVGIGALGGVDSCGFHSSGGEC
jgi:hypothetical protein